MGVTLLLAMLSGGAAVVLLRTAVWKVAHPRVFRQVLRSQGALVARVDRLLMVGVPVAEITVGALLLASLAAAAAPRIGSQLHLVGHLGLAVLGLSFAAHGIRQVATGRTVRCGCTGADDVFGPDTVLRSVLLAVIGAAGALGGPLTASDGGAVQPWIIVGPGALLVAMVLLVGLKPLARGTAGA